MILHAIDWGPLLWRVLAVDSAGLIVVAALLLAERTKGDDE